MISDGGEGRVPFPVATMLEPVTKAQTQHRVERVRTGSQDSHGHHDTLRGTAMELTSDDRTEPMAHHDDVVDVELIEDLVEIEEVLVDT
jgi:hypothetical protein